MDRQWERNNSSCIDASLLSATYQFFFVFLSFCCCCWKNRIEKGGLVFIVLTDGALSLSRPSYCFSLYLVVSPQCFYSPNVGKLSFPLRTETSNPTGNISHKTSLWCYVTVPSIRYRLFFVLFFFTDRKTKESTILKSTHFQDRQADAMQNFLSLCLWFSKEKCSLIQRSPVEADEKRITMKRWVCDRRPKI